MLIWGAGIYFFLVIGDGDRPKTMACLPSAIGHNPNLTLVYREPNPAGGRSRAVINFRGRGRFAADEVERLKVYETMPEIERAPDPDMKGVAVIVEIESITGIMPGYILQMHR